MATRHHTPVPASQPADRSAEIAGLLAQLGALLAEREPAVPAPRPMPARVLLTVKEAAEQLGIGQTKAYELIRTEELESVQIGRLRRVHTDAIRAYAARLCGTSHTDNIAA